MFMGMSGFIFIKLQYSAAASQLNYTLARYHTALACVYNSWLEQLQLLYASYNKERNWKAPDVLPHVPNMTFNLDEIRLDQYTGTFRPVMAKLYPDFDADFSERTNYSSLSEAFMDAKYNYAMSKLPG